MLKTRNYHFGRRIRALCVIMKKNALLRRLRCRPVVFLLMAPGVAAPLFKMMFLSSTLRDINEGVERIWSRARRLS